jgi:nicotinate-nucleotide adenylyltransferase
MRIGIFGGTFDPIHLGHLILAEQCREQAKLDQVWFVPAARPPHKQDQSLTSFDRRTEMLALAIAGQPAFRVDDLERRRPGPSYTIDTLAAIHARQPDDELFLLAGSDVLPDLAHWHEPRRIVELATLLIVARPGWALWPQEQLVTALQLPAPESLRFQVVHAPLIALSSRDLRLRVAQHRSLRYLVPPAVDAYIHAHRLYEDG